MGHLENSVANAAIQALEWKGCQAFRVHSGQWVTDKGYHVHGAIAGTSDYIVSIPKDGYHLIAFMETKGKYKVSDSQISFLREIHKKHIPWIVLDDPAQVELWLGDLWNYHGKPTKIQHILDESTKFVPFWDGRRHRKTEKMSVDIMMQIDQWKGQNNGRKQEP
jgi:hypothetical protein